MSLNPPILKLHPLVVMNISDDLMRARHRNAVHSLHGIIMGKKDFPLTTFEAVISFDAPDRDNNMHIVERIDQYREVFPDLTFVGTYMAMPHDDIVLQRDSFLLVLNERITSSNQLPFTAYWATSEGILTQLEFALHSDPCERISIEHISCVYDGRHKNAGAVSHHIEAEQSIVDVMRMKVEILKSYIQKVLANEIPPNAEFLSEIRKLVQMARHIKPVDDSFDQAYNQNLYDNLIAQTLTKTTSLMSTLAKLSTDTSRIHDPVIKTCAKMYNKESLVPGNSLCR